MSSTDRTGARGGRPSKWTAERCQAICDLVAHDVSPVRAAAAMGMSATTFHDGMAKGRAAAAKQDAGKRLTTAELQSLRFAQEIARASADREAALVAQIEAAAEPQPRLRIVRTRRPIYDARGPVLEPDGQPATSETVVEDITWTADWRARAALLARLDRRAAREELTRTEASETDAPVVNVTALERILAARIAARPLPIESEEERAPTCHRCGPATRPSLTTDDDGADYIYAAWVARNGRHPDGSEKFVDNVDAFPSCPI
jgi:hypothetical protein